MLVDVADRIEYSIPLVANKNKVFFYTRHIEILRISNTSLQL